MSQPQYYIIPPTAPLTDSKGMITRIWWRFLSSLFLTGGSGQSTMSLAELIAEVAALEASQALAGLPTGPDYSSIIAQQQMAAALVPSPAGRIADLERRVTMLEIVYASANNQSARIQKLERTVADLQTLLTVYQPR